MLMPLGDDNSAITQRPYVTYVLIAVNVLVWVLFQQMSGDGSFTYAFSKYLPKLLRVKIL